MLGLFYISDYAASDLPLRARCACRRLGVVFYLLTFVGYFFTYACAYDVGVFEVCGDYICETVVGIAS